MVEEETKERIKQIDRELTRLNSQTTMSRKLDFGFVVDNLFDELSRLQEVNNTPELRQPYQALTDKADNKLTQENEQKVDEIRNTKASFRNYYLKLKKDRKETFSISTGYIFSKLVTLTSYEEADEYRTSCSEEHNEREKLEINQLRIEFITLSSKPTKDRQQNHDDRRQEIVRQLMSMIPRNELNEMIDEGVRIDREVQQIEALAHREQQRQLTRPRSGNSGRDAREMKESKQQDSLGIPQAQREN